MAGAELSALAIADFAAPGVTGFNATGQGKEVAVELTFEKITGAGWSHGSSAESAVPAVSALFQDGLGQSLRGAIVPRR
jgi:hypothetical protein